LILVCDDTKIENWAYLGKKNPASLDTLPTAILCTNVPTTFFH
jgi:hypothetical protein